MVYVITAAFIFCDFVTGILKAIKNKSFRSSKMREGLFHKAGSALVIVLATLIDYAQGYFDLGFSVPLAIPVCVYISLMEIGSMLENICQLNPELMPEKLSALFGVMEKHNDSDKEAK